MKRRIAAILAADVAGFSRLVAEDEEETLRRLTSSRQVFDDHVARYGGRIFNTAGDSVMCAFDSAVEAVRAAIDIQESLRTRNLAYPASRRLAFRIGITIGDVVEQQGDLLGDGVNIAARLEGLADPGGICVSRSVHEAVSSKIAVPFRDIGTRTLRNIPQPVQVFAVALPGTERVAKGIATPMRPERRKKNRRDEEGGDADEDGVRSRRRWHPILIPVVVLTMIFVIVPAYRNLKLFLVGPRDLPPKSSVKQPPGDRAATYPDLAKTATLVSAPRTAPELYHNARLYEARGDVRNARRVYLDFASLKTEFIDPHLRLAALVSAQEGRAAARDLYRILAAAHPAKAVTLVHALQQEGAERRSGVEAFASANPDNPAGSYFLAEEHSEERRGGQTLTDRRLEFEALERVLDAAADGRLAPLFLDETVMADWVERARKRKAAAEIFFRVATTRPTASFTRTGAGWKVTLSMPEAATSIAHRVGETGEFQTAGPSAAQGATGKSEPQPAFELARDQAKTVLYVIYTDTAGNEAGPFAISFDPQTALADGERAILVATPSSWVTFLRKEGGLTFDHLIAHRCGIKKVSVGFNAGPLEHNLPLPPCDPSNPQDVPADAHTFATIPPGVESVSIRLTYADNSESEVRSFSRE